jgi:hypothetical protein
LGIFIHSSAPHSRLWHYETSLTATGYTSCYTFALPYRVQTTFPQSAT